MTDYEEGSARIGVTQTTMDIHGYPHPLFPNVTLWDLPGFETLEFKPQDYLKKVNFSQYDFFIIVASERFSENDVLLAQEIKKMQKKYYYVYSKMDLYMDSERRKPNFNENQVIEKIKTYCLRTLLHFHKVFGLDEESLRRAAKQVSRDYQVLKSAVKKSPRSSEITPELVIGLLNKSVFCGTLIVFGLVFDFGPVLGLLAGSLVGGVSSFVTTLYMVKSFLKDVVEDAESVRAKAAEP
uniref:Uncharacterized protein n=1 Tax=Sphaerodactylus townsendi TaxID=933632 RepID=A0ACB8FS46_9SAUR